MTRAELNANVRRVREVFTAEQVRTAERVVLDRVPPGALMRRAAFGLAVVARRMLAGTAGRRVALLVGAGDNGGDALWAGAELRRRGVGVTAVLLDPERAHAQGLAALRRAGGRVVGTGPDAAAAVVARGPRRSTASSASPVAGRCAPPRPSWSTRRTAAGSRCWPSTRPAASTPTRARSTGPR